jgi:hypothetical protein
LIMEDIMSILTRFNTQDELVGQGATTGYGGDSYAHTIIGVIRFASGSRAGQPRVILIQRDKAIPCGGVWPDIEYTFECDPKGAVEAIKVGNKRPHGPRVSIGTRRERRDPHF